MKRLKLKHQGKFGTSLDFVFNNMPRDFGGQRQWETHRFVSLFHRRHCRDRRFDLGRFRRLFASRFGIILSEPGQEKSQWRNGRGRRQAAATYARKTDQGQKQHGLERFPLQFHCAEYKCRDYHKATGKTPWK